MDLNNKNVLVIGSGISGVGCVKLLLKMESNVTVLEQNESVKADDVYEKLGTLNHVNPRVVIGEISDEELRSFDLLVPSPGVPLDTGLPEKMRGFGIPVWSEIELGFRCGHGRVAAITGTNGKTTTTSLVGEICRAYFDDVKILGNIGRSYPEAAFNLTDATMSVIECSSFQLEGVEKFAPNVSAVLNVTPDHLNRHHTMEGYAKAKANICINQSEDDFCILNYDNEYTREMAKETKAKVIYFSSANKLEKGIYLEDDFIYMAEGDFPVKIMHVRDMNLVGMCNVENVMAAIGICLGLKIPMDTIVSVISSFKAVEHRIEFVGNKNDVDFYNDSKGTNPDAAIQGIRAMNRPTILIGGGYDKDADYNPWILETKDKVKLFVLIGATREKIARCIEDNGMNNYVFCDTFEEAMDICVKNANEGDAILLSPACASWGMFKDYEERGKAFKEYYNKL